MAELKQFIDAIGLGNGFAGIFMRDEVPDIKNKSMIINLDDSLGTGTHWVAINNGYYFDPFGQAVPDDVKSAIKLKHYNTTPLQEITATSCGWHCCWFIYNNIRGVNQYYKFLLDYPRQESHAENEKYLAQMINSIPPVKE